MKKLLLIFIIGILLISSLLTLASLKNSSIETADAGVLNGTYTHSGGDYTDTQTDDTSYYYVGTGSKNTAINAYIELNFSIDNLGINKNAITNLSVYAIYCHDGTSGGGDCSGDNAEGTADGDQNIEAYNFSGSAWVDIGNLVTNDAGSEVSGTWSIPDGWTDYIDSNNIIIQVKDSGPGIPDENMEKIMEGPYRIYSFYFAFYANSI